MQDINQILDKIKETRSIASDNALAGVLGQSRQNVSNWRRGKSLPDAVACARISELSEVPLARVLGIVGEARAISREEKAVWRRLAAAAAVVLMAGAGGALVMSNGQPQAIDILGFNFTSLYIMH